jgi:hypothetical protein
MVTRLTALACLVGAAAVTAVDLSGHESSQVRRDGRVFRLRSSDSASPNTPPSPRSRTASRGSGCAGTGSR